MGCFTHSGFCTNINMSLYRLHMSQIPVFRSFSVRIAHIRAPAVISFYRMIYNCAAAAGFRTAVTLPEKERIYI